MSVLKDNAKIGILNRGEAALRFIRAVREYNAENNCALETVAFYIDKEEYAPFVKQSDHSLALSSLSLYPGKQASPYLDHELLLEALKETGCEAIWVGWGFVSEDAVFAEKIEKAGIIFLGPSSKAMAVLGDKIQAKDLAESADVPILPWSKKSVDSLEEARKVSEEIGYPVIVKAANAGGGRGIRFVWTPEELEQQYNSARDETLRITGNTVVFIEYLVAKGRHLEVQVLADQHGNVNTFGVRDCSVQRKNQKIIEETPPPQLDEDLIKEMEAAAARLIKAAEYVGAGTVEYLFDLASDRFFFMEVNTRLQVEHPITETLYGMDLVKGQIAVARGEVVDWSAKTPRGSVIEVRLNAEDPDREFNPAPGLVNLFKAPAGPGIRVDSGIEEGSDIPSEFDSMVAKIIAQGDNRHEAMSRLKRALTEMRIRIKDGTTNRSFLIELLNNASIQAGGVHTGFVEELLKDRNLSPADEAVQSALLAGAVEVYLQQKQQDFMNFRQQLSKSGRPRILPQAKGYEVNLSTGGCGYSFKVRELAQQEYEISLDDQVVLCRYIKNEQEATLFAKGQRHNILMVPRGDMMQCEVDGYPVMLESDSGGYVSSPSPAIVLSLSSKVGQEVKKGDVLLVLEAMKMEMLVEAPQDGTICEICVEEGAQVAAGQPLVQLEASAEGEEEVQETAEPVSFNTLVKEDDPQTQRRNCIKALFMGFDSDDKEQEKALALLEDKENQGEFLLELIQAYNGVESLFTSTQLEGSTLARPMTYPEMMSHYFRRVDDREKGLPQGFLDDLEKAFALYPSCNCDEEIQQEEALFHIFRSHSGAAAKQEILKKMLAAFSQVVPNKELLGKAEEQLDQLIEISQSSNLSLADAAIHCRSMWMDKPRRDAFDKKNEEELKEMISKLSASPSEEELEVIDNSGSAVLRKLVNLADSQGSDAQGALSLIGYRMNRDRAIESCEIIQLSGEDFCLVQGDSFRSLIGLVKEDLSNLPSDLSAQIQEGTEVLLLSKVSDLSKAQPMEEKLQQVKGSSNSSLSLGIYCGSQGYFSSFNYDGQWKKNELHQGFSPLQYRELRVYRFSNFNLKMLYRSENVFLLEATAKDNPKDIRLFSLVDVAQAGEERDSKGNLDRLVFLETRLMEAIYAMRAAQAEYKYRLVWNRIIIHNRSLLEMSIKDLQKYGQSIMPLTADLGLEKMVIYTVRKRWSEKTIRELELDYTVVSDSKFELRHRKPSEDLLESYDKYVSRAVVARQRNSVYPYEFLKILTGDASLDSRVKGGKFQEYDIKIEANGEQSYYDCSDRTAGQNEGNIVFGLVTNQVDFLDVDLQRVIILADPTKDLGSLSEPECRRINAALDMADEKKLPVEWIAISSGAKITMDSGTENLDWTAATLRRIIEFTQAGGELNIIVPGINVGAQSYWNAEATMLMHTRGLLIMTDDGSLLLTGKKALDFSGSVSGETNLDIGGAEKIMAPNGQAQLRVANLAEAYQLLFDHYRYSYVAPGSAYPPKKQTSDPADRDVSKEPYQDYLDQGFETIGDIFSFEKNPERKKPFDIRQVMNSLIDSDASYCERWRSMQDSDTAIVWETQMGGNSVGMIGIESRNLSRIGEVPFDGPESWSGGTLFPQSSKKVARGINAFSGRVPLVLVANLSGFDGSPESLRRLQLEYGAEIGRAVVNFKGPISFVVVARYHGGAYVVFSKSLNPNLRSAALEGSFASVIGGAPAAAVVFPKMVLRAANEDSRVINAKADLKAGKIDKEEFNSIFKKVKNEKQTETAQQFDQVHSVERAKKVGSIDDIITAKELRPYIIDVIEKGMR